MSSQRCEGTYVSPWCSCNSAGTLCNRSGHNEELVCETPCPPPRARPPCPSLRHAPTHTHPARRPWIPYPDTVWADEGPWPQHGSRLRPLLHPQLGSANLAVQAVPATARPTTPGFVIFRCYKLDYVVHTDVNRSLLPLNRSDMAQIVSEKGDSQHGVQGSTGAPFGLRAGRRAHRTMVIAILALSAAHSVADPGPTHLRYVRSAPCMLQRPKDPND